MHSEDKIEIIIREVEDYTGITMDQMRSKDRDEMAVLARIIFTGVMRTLGYSNNRTAKALHLDHSSTSHYAGLIKDDISLAEEVSICLSKMAEKIGHKKTVFMYDMDMICDYYESEESKQKLWDLFIEFCKKHNASTGEAIQKDGFTIEAPLMVAKAIDEIIKFETSWRR